MPCETHIDDIENCKACIGPEPRMLCLHNTRIDNGRKCADCRADTFKRALEKIELIAEDDLRMRGDPLVLDLANVARAALRG